MGLLDNFLGKKKEPPMPTSTGTTSPATARLSPSTERRERYPWGRSFSVLSYGVLLSLLSASGVAQTTALSVVQAADYRPYVAPGSLAVVFGQNLAGATVSAQLDSSGQLPTQLSGTSVQICGENAGLIFVSPMQINLFIPGDLQPGLCSVQVQTTASSISGSVDIRPVSPGIFVLNNQLGGAAVLDGLTFKLGPFYAKNPTGDPTYLAFFGTGFRNAIASILVDSASPGVTGQIVDTTGKVWPTPVLYAGPVPGSFGLDQVNVVLPPDLDATGYASFSIVAGSVSSNTVTFGIRDSVKPEVFGLSTPAALPGTTIPVFGQHLGLASMVKPGRIQVQLSMPSAATTVISPTLVSGSELDFIVPLTSDGHSATFSGPVSVCVIVDSDTACAQQALNILPQLAPSLPVGQTLLNAIQSASANTINMLNSLGESQAATQVANKTAILVESETEADRRRNRRPSAVRDVYPRGWLHVQFSVRSELYRSYRESDSDHCGRSSRLTSHRCSDSQAKQIQAPTRRYN